MPKTVPTPCYIGRDAKSRILRFLDHTGGGQSMSSFLIRQAMFTVQQWETSQGLSHIVLPEQEATAS